MPISAVLAAANATPTTNANNAPVTIPAGAAAGWKALLITCQSTGAATCPAPSGWSLVTPPAGSSNPQDDGLNSMRTYLFEKVLTAGDPGSTVTPTWTASGRVATAVICAEGAQDAIDNILAWLDTTADGLLTIPTITPVANDCLQVGIVTDRFAAAAATGVTPNAAITERADVATTNTTNPRLGAWIGTIQLTGQAGVAQPTYDNTYASPARNNGWVLTLAPASTGPITRTAADVLTAADTADRAVTFARASSDTATASDATTRTTAKGRTGTDALTTTDTAARTRALTRAGSDTLAASDTASTSTGGGTRSAADTLAGSDTAARTVTRTRALTETTAAGDTAARTSSRSRTAIDANTTADTASRSRALARLAGDSVTLGDTVSRLLQLLRAAADASALADLVAVTGAHDGHPVEHGVLTLTTPPGELVTALPGTAFILDQTSSRLVATTPPSALELT